MSSGTGSIQLLVQGVEDQILYGKPSYSYFSSVYMKNLQFYSKIVDTSARVQIGGGKRIRSELGRNGDLIKNIFIRITTDSTTASIPEFSFYQFIDSVDLIIGGQIIERLTGEYMFMYYKLLATPNERKFVETISETFSDSDLVNDKTFFLPLPFFYFNNLKKLIPINQISKQKIEIELTIFDKLQGTPPYTDIFKFITIPVSYIILEEPEILGFKQDIQISQLYREFHYVESNVNAITIDLNNIKNPVLDMYVYAMPVKTETRGKEQLKKKSTILNCFNSNVITDYYQTSNNMIQSMELLFNGESYIDKSLPSQYYTHVVPSIYYNNPGVFSNRRGCVYNFTINPLTNEPVGSHINFSRIRDKKLKIILNDHDGQEVNIKIFTRSLNILRIADGLAGVMFAHRSQFDTNIFASKLPDPITEGVFDSTMTINNYRVTASGLQYTYAEDSRSNADTAVLHYKLDSPYTSAEPIEFIKNSPSYTALPGTLTLDFTPESGIISSGWNVDGYISIPALDKEYVANAILWKEFTETYSQFYSSDFLTFDAEDTFTDANLSLLSYDDTTNIGNIICKVNTTYSNAYYNIATANIAFDSVLEPDLTSFNELQPITQVSAISVGSPTSPYTHRTNVVYSNTSTTYYGREVLLFTFEKEFTTTGTMSSNFGNGLFTFVNSADNAYIVGNSMTIESNTIPWLGITGASASEDQQTITITKSFNWTNDWSYQLNGGAPITVSGGATEVRNISINVSDEITVNQPINGTDIVIESREIFSLSNLSYSNGDYFQLDSTLFILALSIGMKDDGTAIYPVNKSGFIERYDMSTSYDIKTASNSAVDNVTITPTNAFADLSVSGDGTSWYFCENSSKPYDNINFWTASPGWDLSTLTQDPSLLRLGGNPRAVFKQSNKIYVCQSGQIIRQFELTGDWVPATDQGSVDLSSYLTGTGGINGLFLNSNGTKLITIHTTGFATASYISEFSLSVPYDLVGSTITLLNEILISDVITDIPRSVFSPAAIVIDRATYSNIYLSDTSEKRIYQIKMNK